MPTLPVIKLLTSSGLGSRRVMAEAINNGRVAINGKVVESYTKPVDLQKDVVTLDNNRVAFQTERKIYIMLNKPRGVVSTTIGDRGEKTVLDVIPPKYHQSRLYPVGRLDKESTGLILLTNDGELTYNLTHPRFEHEKEYYIHAECTLTKEEKRRLEQGIELEEGKTSPAKVKILNLPPYNYSITIHEGKKRQVRRMFVALGYRVLELTRVRIGSLQLGDLSPGSARELTPAELRALKSQALKK